VAKRATSPKAPKAKMPGSRGASPAGSRANSPTPASRATSPLATSPAAAGEFKNNKRKADDSSTSPINGTSPNDVPKPKKKKLQNAPDYASCTAAELEVALIEWLKNMPTATTKNCVQHFNSYMLGANGPERRKEFSALVKRVATLKDAVLTLRPGLG
jgi:transcription initiation factor TFIIF subunit alpha